MPATAPISRLTGFVPPMTREMPCVSRVPSAPCMRFTVSGMSSNALADDLAQQDLGHAASFHSHVIGNDDSAPWNSASEKSPMQG